MEGDLCSFKYSDNTTIDDSDNEKELQHLRAEEGGDDFCKIRGQRPHTRRNMGARLKIGQRVLGRLIIAKSGTLSGGSMIMLGAGTGVE